MPHAEDLLGRLGRVVEATRTVVGVDGTGLTLTSEDGQPRWVAATDAAMQLLEEVQHDFGEGPCLAAFAEDRVVAVEDLRSELVWDRIAVVVRQLQVRGVLSVPVRLADQPVGTLNVYATQPRAWTPAEVQALGAFAIVTAELVRTTVELANHQVEAAQLRQALASRVWIEQAKGMVAATQGVALDEAFQQLRGRVAAPRPSSPPPPAVEPPSHMTATPIAPGTSSSASGAGSKTGGASLPDTTNSPETSSLAHSSQPLSSTGAIESGP